MDGVFVTSELRAAGITYDEIRTNPRLSHLRRGAWVASPATQNKLAGYLQMIAATYRNLPVGGVVSHASAAALHGLPLPYAEMGHVNVTRPQPHRPFTARHVRVGIGTLAPDEVISIQGLPTTSLARTIADIARTWEEPWAVAATDAALARGVTRLEILAPHGPGSRLVGHPQARRVIAFADARSGSPGESISRLLMHQAGLPAPSLQRRFVWEGGVDIPDFDWDLGGGVIGEFDGYGKYMRVAPDGSQDPARAVYLEKRREDRLRRRVNSFVRWGWEDLQHPESFIAPIAASLGVQFRPLGILSLL